MMGMHGEAWVNTAIQEADLLIALGMRFDDRVTGNLKTYAPNARKIHVDIDPAEFNKNVSVDAAISGDVGRGGREWLPRVRRGRPSRRGWPHISDLKGDAAVRDIQNLPDDGHLYAAHVINDLWRITEGKAIVVTDVGQHQMWEAQYYKHDAPRSLITSGGLGTMGFALPAAIGAKMARPDAEVWVVVGDGGFQMTCASWRRSCRKSSTSRSASSTTATSAWCASGRSSSTSGAMPRRRSRGPDFVKLAEAFGVWGATVTTRAEVEPTVAAARRQRGALIDFRVEQEDSVYPMVPAGADLHKMIRRPSPIVGNGDERRVTKARMQTFALSYVDNKPGVLNRVASLFRRRAFNIESLTVGPPRRPASRA